MTRRALAKRNKGGRPTKYLPQHCEQAYRLALLKCTEADMANVFGVDERTFDRWIAAHPQLRRSITRGREYADAHVTERLLERAMGYTHPEEKIFCNAEGEVTRVKTLKHYPPDERAASLWLRNRQPGKWRDQPIGEGAVQVIINTDLRPQARAVPGRYTIELEPEGDDSDK